MKKVIVMILLLLIIAGTVMGSLTIRGWTAELQAENEARVRAAQSQLDDEKAAFAAIDPNTTEGTERELEAERQIITEAQEQIAALETEIRGLDDTTAEVQRTAEEKKLDEETQYYLTVYQSLHEGMEKVEGYIEGN